MTTTRLILRLLDSAGVLLGWTEHEAAVKGDGKLWSRGAVTLPVEKAGFAVSLSIHWVDVNTETRITPPPMAVRAGDVLPVFEHDCPMVKVGEMPVGLPAVTVGSRRIGIPVGQVGVVGVRP